MADNIFINFLKIIYTSHCQKFEKKIAGPTYFWTLQSFDIFRGPVFQIKLDLLNGVLLSGFQSSWKPLSKAVLVNVMGQVGIVNSIIYETKQVFIGLRHGKLSLSLTQIYISLKGVTMVHWFQFKHHNWFR